MNQGKFFVRLAALLIAFSLSSMALSGHAQVASGKRIALVIGNDAYQRVEPLKNARNDARLTSNTLNTRRKDLGEISYGCVNYGKWDKSSTDEQCRFAGQVFGQDLMTQAGIATMGNGTVDVSVVRRNFEKWVDSR